MGRESLPARCIHPGTGAACLRPIVAPASAQGRCQARLAFGGERLTFLHPILAAAAIGCVSIPIIIHILMRRRRKPVMWAAMRFLLEAYRQHKRRLRLEQILLLAARCLIIALAGLAIARPLLGRAGVLGGRGSVTLYLLIDNGLASSAQAPGEKDALGRHKTS